MALRFEDVRRIARLARLEVSERELEAVRGELDGILGLVADLQAVDTAGVAPMAHAQDVTLRLRDDGVTEADRRAAHDAIAPAVEAGLYLVPKVIE